MSAAFRAALIAAGLAMLGGCASTPPREAAQAADPLLALEQAEPPVISVTNRNWADVDVFLLLCSTRYRLGMVTTGHTGRFPLGRYPGWDTHSLQVEVDPVGSNETFTSSEFVVSSGQWVEYTVEARLPLSSYAVHNY